MGQANDPLRILASSVALGSSGGITVLEGLGGALARRDDVEIRFAIPTKLAARVGSHIPPHLLVPIDVRSVRGRLRWEETQLPKLTRAMGADYLFGTTNTLPVVHWLGGRGTLLIQNIAPLLPEIRGLYRGIARARFETLRLLTLRSVRRADVTFLFTRYGRDLVTSLVPGANVVAIPPGGLPLLPDSGEERVVGDHILVLADLYRYKGVETVIEALADPRLATLKLFVAGAPLDTSYSDGLKRLTTTTGVEDRVSFMGRLPRSEVVGLLRSARCLVQPSRVESLALPLLEALQLGVQVVSTDLPVARELCGDAAQYFPVGDVAALRELLCAPGGSEPSVPKLSWDVTAGNLVHELRSLLASNT